MLFLALIPGELFILYAISYRYICFKVGINRVDWYNRIRIEDCINLPCVRRTFVVSYLYKRASVLCVVFCSSHNVIFKWHSMFIIKCLRKENERDLFFKW